MILIFQKNQIVSKMASQCLSVSKATRYDGISDRWMFHLIDYSLRAVASWSAVNLQQLCSGVLICSKFATALQLTAANRHFLFSDRIRCHESLTRGERAIIRRPVETMSRAWLEARGWSRCLFSVWRERDPEKPYYRYRGTDPTRLCI